MTRHVLGVEIEGSVDMLITLLIVVVLLLTAEAWFPFLMNAGAAAFWPPVLVLAVVFVVGSFYNPFLLAVPVLFLGAVVVYALACHHLIDRPALKRMPSERGESLN